MIRIQVYENRRDFDVNLTHRMYSSDKRHVKKSVISYPPGAICCVKRRKFVAKLSTCQEPNYLAPKSAKK